MQGLDAGRRWGAAGRRPAGERGGLGLNRRGRLVGGRRGGGSGRGGRRSGLRPCCCGLGTKLWSGRGPRPPSYPARPPLWVANDLRRNPAPVAGPSFSGARCPRPERPLPASGSGLSGVGLLFSRSPAVKWSPKPPWFAGSTVLTFLAEVSAPVPTFLPILR